MEKQIRNLVSDTCLDCFFAGQIRTLALVTRSGADMTANVARHGARLNASLARFLAQTRMTQCNTLVSPTWDRFVARQATWYLVNVAGHSFSELVFAVTPSLGEYRARRAGRITVAVMKNLVSAGVLTSAGTIAGGSSRAAGNGRINYRCTALTVQLIETHLLTRLASPCKTMKNRLTKNRFILILNVVILYFELSL